MGKADKTFARISAACQAKPGLADVGFKIADLGCEIWDCGLRIWEGIGHGVRSQNPEFSRKAIKIEFFSTTGYWLLLLRISYYDE
jgi:hypothetical protein